MRPGRSPPHHPFPHGTALQPPLGVGLDLLDYLVVVVLGEPGPGLLVGGRPALLSPLLFFLAVLIRFHEVPFRRLKIS